MNDNILLHAVVPDSTATIAVRLVFEGNDLLCRDDTISAPNRRSSARLAFGGGTNNEPSDCDGNDSTDSNIATRTRNSKVAITCSDYGLDRATKYSNYHFCRQCENYDDMMQFKSNKKKKANREYKTYKCILKHTNRKHPTLLKNEYVHYSIRNSNHDSDLHEKDDDYVRDSKDIVDYNDDVNDNIDGDDNTNDGNSDYPINDIANDSSNTTNNISITGGNTIDNNTEDNDVVDVLGDYSYNIGSNNDTSDDEGPPDNMKQKNDAIKKTRENQSTFFNNDVLYDNDSDDEQLSVPHNNKRRKKQIKTKKTRINSTNLLTHNNSFVESSFAMDTNVAGSIIHECKRAPFDSVYR